MYAPSVYADDEARTLRRVIPQLCYPAVNISHAFQESAAREVYTELYREIPRKKGEILSNSIGKGETKCRGRKVECGILRAIFIRDRHSFYLQQRSKIILIRNAIADAFVADFHRRLLSFLCRNFELSIYESSISTIQCPLRGEN